MTKYVTLKNGHRLIEPTDEEDAAITAAAMSDPDAMPLGVAASIAPPVKRSVGRPKLDNPSEKVTMRIDPVTLAHLRATGKGWQTRVNDVLREAVASGRL